MILFFFNKNLFRYFAEQKLPSLTTDDDDGSENFDDSYEYEDEDDDECDGIDSESIFRTRVLTTALDDEDTSFVKGSKSRGGKKQLKRSQSLPLYTSQLARRHRGLDVLTPLSDREESCPPDGESVGSGTSVGACSVSSVSSQGGPGLAEEQQDLEDSHDSLENPSSETPSSEVAASDHACDNIVGSELFNHLASDFNAVQYKNQEQDESISQISQPCSPMMESETYHPESIECASPSSHSPSEDSSMPSHETPSLEISASPKLRSEILNNDDSELPLSSLQISEPET